MGLNPSGKAADLDTILAHTGNTEDERQAAAAYVTRTQPDPLHLLEALGLTP